MLTVYAALWSCVVAGVVGNCLMPETDRRWHQGIVPWDADEVIRADPQRMARIDWAIRHVNAMTSVLVRPRMPGQDLHWILFKDAPPGQCSSFVGRNYGLGAQAVSISSTCPQGSVAHELLHAIGVYHEQSRPDRDAYVTVDAVAVAGNGNYRVVADAWMLGPYDYGSIMHYAANAAMQVPPGVEAGQRRALSQLDVQGVDWLVQNGTQPPPRAGPAEPPPPPPDGQPPLPPPSGQPDECSTSADCSAPFGVCVRSRFSERHPFVRRCYCMVSGTTGRPGPPSTVDAACRAVAPTPSPPAPAPPLDPCTEVVESLQACLASVGRSDADYLHVDLSSDG